MNRNSEFIVVEGIIGSGKTTLISGLKKNLERQGFSVVIIPEQVEKWKASGLLEKFYNNQERWAYHFQTCAFKDYILACKEAFDNSSAYSDFYIVERSPLSNKIFAELLFESGKMNIMEMNDYLEWSKCWEMLSYFIPTLFIYCKVSVGTAMERIRIRKRAGENMITAQYQTDLSNKHNKVFGGSKINKVPVLNVSSENLNFLSLQIQEQITKSVLDTCGRQKKLHLSYDEDNISDS